MGHSDADVVIHAICDAILGALGLGDIGHHFPDTDAKFKGVDSRVLLREVATMLDEYQIGNLDATIIAQAPKLAPHIKHMKSNISRDLGCRESQINIKATTTEKLGFAGREQGIEAHAVVLLQTHKDA